MALRHLLSLTILLFASLTFFNVAYAKNGCAAAYGNTNTGTIHYPSYVQTNEHSAERIAFNACIRSAESNRHCISLGWACNQYMSISRLNLDGYYTFWTGYSRYRNGAEDEAMLACDRYRLRRKNPDQYRCSLRVNLRAHR